MHLQLYMMARHEDDDRSHRRRRSVESSSESHRPRRGRDPSASEDRQRKSRRDEGRRSRDSRSRERGRHNREERSHRHRSRSRSPDHKSRRHKERGSVEETRPRDRRYEEDRRKGKSQDADRDRGKGDRDRDRTRTHKHRRSYSGSHSPPRRHDNPPSRSESRNESAPIIPKRTKGPLPSQQDAFKGTPKGDSEDSTPAVDKQKPNFSQTGRLAAETNTVNVNGGSIVLKYHEPPEARKPPSKEAWRLYIFKGEDLLDTVELGGRSCWLVGRERLVVDFPIEHPSCSKQHAAIQFRYIEKKNEFGDRDGRVRPYLIDLESANGTTVNGEPAPGGRYMELMDKDVLKFGLSTRECVLMLPPS